MVRISKTAAHCDLEHPRRTAYPTCAFTENGALVMAMSKTSETVYRSIFVQLRELAVNPKELLNQPAGRETRGEPA